MRQMAHWVALEYGYSFRYVWGDLSVAEFWEHVAYLKIKSDRERKAVAEARSRGR